jgi:hypothetical protein
MKRIFLTATASSMLALAIPGMALAAHHGKHHHGAHHASAHKRHAARAHLVSFGAASVPGSPSGSQKTSATPATPSNETAGTVASYENGVLTIKLNNESTVSGLVTENTEIECESASPTPTTTDEDDQGGGDDQSGSESGEHGGSSTQHGDGRHSQGDGGEGQGDEGEPQSCPANPLAKGVIVRKAELRLSSTGAVWEKVDLILP